mgnify:CR=1 FL=1|jgi:hypothetical protein
MEWTYSTLFNYIIAFWIAGIAIAFWRLFLPSMEVVRRLDSDNLVIRYQLISAITFIVLTTFLMPFLIRVLLDDNHRERFLNGFIPGIMGEK